MLQQYLTFKFQDQKIIKEYNATMGEVDLYNHLIHFYCIKIKSKKWTLRLIFHAVVMAVINSWVEYKIVCDL